MDQREDRDLRSDDEIAAKLVPAFDSVVLSDDAAERILGNLVAAQSQREELEEQERREQEQRAAAERARADELAAARRRRRNRRIVLPIAACLVVACVGVGAAIGTGALQIGAGKATNQAAYKEVSEETALEDAAVAESAAPAGTVEEGDSAKAESAASADASAPTPDPAATPVVTLSDGAVCNLVVEKGAPVPVDAAQLEAATAQATASSEDGRTTVPCSVRLVANSRDIAVSFDGTTWLLATRSAS